MQCLFIALCIAPLNLCKAVSLQERRLAPGFYLASKNQSINGCGLGEPISSLLMSSGDVSLDTNSIQLK